MKKRRIRYIAVALAMVLVASSVSGTAFVSAETTTTEATKTKEATTTEETTTEGSKAEATTTEKTTETTTTEVASTTETMTTEEVMEEVSTEKPITTTGFASNNAMLDAKRKKIGIKSYGGTVSTDWDYIFEYGYMVLTSYKGSSTDVVVPASLDGRLVALDNKFKFNDAANINRLTSIRIEPNVFCRGTHLRSSWNRMCQNMTRLKSFVIEGDHIDTATGVIQKTASDCSEMFKGCTNLEYTNFADYVEQDTISEIFWGCTNLRKIGSDSETVPGGENDAYVTLSTYGLGQDSSGVFKDCSKLSQRLRLVFGTESTYFFGNWFNGAKSLRYIEFVRTGGPWSSTVTSALPLGTFTGCSANVIVFGNIFRDCAVARDNIILQSTDAYSAQLGNCKAVALPTLIVTDTPQIKAVTSWTENGVALTAANSKTLNHRVPMEAITYKINTTDTAATFTDGTTSTRDDQHYRSPSGPSDFYVDSLSDINVTKDTVAAKFSLTSTIKPTRPGWKFKGWYEDAACTQKFEGTDTINWAVEYDKVLYAGWGTVKETKPTWVEIPSGIDLEKSTTSNKAEKKATVKLVDPLPALTGTDFEYSTNPIEVTCSTNHIMLAPADASADTNKRINICRSDRSPYTAGSVLASLNTGADGTGGTRSVDFWLISQVDYRYFNYSGTYNGNLTFTITTT